ncbi:hypothetical protein H0H92_006602 [Tricholoma furcatifolium]|nr:hypothetical protein H0H92_006602 [Tricholoma furcatifolium]
MDLTSSKHLLNNSDGFPQRCISASHASQILLIISTSTLKVSKNPGLALDLNGNITTTLFSKHLVPRPLPSAISSLTNTPELEPDWTNEDDASDDGDDTEAQYIYIEAESLFFHAPSSACTTSYLSVSGFPFACDALAEDDPLFSQSLGYFDDALDTDLEDSAVIIADAELMEETGSQANVEWRFTEPLDEVKPTGKEVTLEVPEACTNNLYPPRTLDL